MGESISSDEKGLRQRSMAKTSMNMDSGILEAGPELQAPPAKEFLSGSLYTRSTGSRDLLQNGILKGHFPTSSGNVGGVYNIDLIDSQKDDSIDVVSMKATDLMVERPQSRQTVGGRQQ